MKKSLDSILRSYPRPYLTHTELDGLLEGTQDSRYSRVKRLLAHGKLVQVRRGLYSLGEAIGHCSKPHPFEVAQFIYGPSYVSLESALSFHGLIPEAVYTITSVTSKKSNEFMTPLGVFSYQHLPLKNLYIEVELITENNISFLMAKPWKAICDYIYCYKKDWRSLKPLLESLRIDRESLPALRYEEIEILNEYYKHSRLSRFLKAIREKLTYER